MVDNPITPNTTPTPNTNQPANKSVLDLSNFSLTPNSVQNGTTEVKSTTIVQTNTTSVAPTPTTPKVPTPTPIPTTPTAPTIQLNLDTIAKPENKAVAPNTGIGKPNNTLNLGNLSIKKIEVKETNKQKTNELLASGVKNEPIKEGKKPFISNISVIVTSYVIIFVAILGIIGIQSYRQYISLRNEIQIAEDKKGFVEKGEKAELFLSKTLKINEYENRVNQTNLLVSDTEKDTAIDTLKANQNLNYTQKRNIIQNNLNSLSTVLIQNNTKLEGLKSEITKYGFIPKELYDMTQKGEGIDNIRRAMVLTENIKFVTAFKVFGYLQSFLQGFANDSGIDPVEAESQLRELNENGEKDIITYTNNCYFNPYEVSDDCSITNDFDNYYMLMDKTSKISPSFIKKIASYTERKLLEKDIPMYTITFPEFNPKGQKIEFKTEINTSRQDELALNKVGIINPHLYIITNLINTLKQSLLVIGENIKIDQINILPKTIRVGSTVFNVNTSSLNFSLPIQQTDQREITDFFSNQSTK